MKTENCSISKVLAQNATSFYIPPFQRSYAWGKTEIERFFEDIKKIIDSDLDPKQLDKQEHFFGTIVIKEEKDGFANRFVIVDGQQRLTTTLLFLIALRDLEKNEKNKNFITDMFLVNPNSTYPDKIKLKQVTKDWEAYRALVNSQKSVTGTIITKAYNSLKNLIEVQTKSHLIPFEHYITAIGRMNVAVIFLDERPFKGEDPQIIFETLNSLGKPLTLADLVRNFILLNLESTKQTDIYEKTWHPEIEDVLKEYTSEFFRDYLQYKKSTSLKVVSDNNTKELYQQFKEFVEKNFQKSKDDFIDDIVKYVKLYKWIITEKNEDLISDVKKHDGTIKELLRNIFHDIKAEAFKPFVLGLLEYHQYAADNEKITDADLISLLETIRTYLIRRRVLGLTQGENKHIVLLCKKINDIAQEKISLIELLTTMSYRLRLPNDDEITKGLETINFYEELKKYAKFILGKIEEKNSKVSVDFRNKQITIEHIMPQTLDKTWKEELGKNWNKIHDDYLHNIGNLILTEFNSEIGNKSFTEKKQKLQTSNLYFRNNIIKKKRWNEQSIKEHQKDMIKWFLETFPLPDEYKHADNYKSERREEEWLSPLDDTDNIAEGNKPEKLAIRDKIFEVKTWQDVFLNFMKNVKENYPGDFQYFVENQREVFEREDVILAQSKLKELIEDNKDLLKRYKTLEGKFCEEENLKEDDFFYYINMSASTCMRRIANIMNKLYMKEDDVKIKLK
jgi:uncharacterized protein with ParB-like and HNH nuclease domain